jgi:flavin-binding protein dodecin
VQTQEAPVSSFLVVANKTLGGEGLATHLHRVIQQNPAARFVVVVPFSAPVPVDAGGAMGGIAVIDLETEEYLESTARARLGALLDWLQAAGVEARGEVVRGDPLAAMERVAQSNTFDEIIISTLPERISQWLRIDLVHRAARKFSMPITTVVGATGDEALPPAEPVNGTTASHPAASSNGKKVAMGESVYKIIELVGTSTESWEKAAAAAVAKASRTLRDLRVAEIAQLDLVIDNGQVSAYRAKVKVSFKYEGE